MDLKKIKTTIEQARERNEAFLLETEGMEILDAIGIDTPAHVFVRNSSEIRTPDIEKLGARVVIKVVSAEIAHKTDIGGVKVVANDPDVIAATIDKMQLSLADRPITGFLINECVDYDARIGGEILIGLRWTADFGPVITLGAGGVYTEFLSEAMRTGEATSTFSVALANRQSIDRAINRCAITRLVTSTVRSCKPRIAQDVIRGVVEQLTIFARHCVPDLISELEINPLVIRDGRLVALDVLVKASIKTNDTRRERPIWKLKKLLVPQSIAIAGVSERLNPGRIILQNIIKGGFNRSRIYVVKPGSGEIEGCRCFENIASLPQRVDLMILAISASQLPQIIEEIIDLKKAESLIVIPGGLEERRGSDEIIRRLHSRLEASRLTEWRGPVVNGGNCLGIRSLPGRYDTMFIPEYKLPRPSSTPSPVAIISQSGAFAISRMSKLARLNPKYTISLGNQMDLTVGDYLNYLAEDDGIKVFGIYIEGFAKADGIQFLRAAHEITKTGRMVILYRAGRTKAGAIASSSHTASIAGAYETTRELCSDAGVLIAESLEDFEDLLNLSALLRQKQVSGLRLGAISNAGFECVAFADNLGSFTLPGFSSKTMKRLTELMASLHIDSLVDAHNPLDLTPMAHDQAFEESVKAVLGDDGIDVGIVGCVPLTVALSTLPSSAGEREAIDNRDSIARRLQRLNRQTSKAWLATIDAGAQYDPMVRMLEEAGIPTFRTADRALRLFERYCTQRLSARYETLNAEAARA